MIAIQKIGSDTPSVGESSTPADKAQLPRKYRISLSVVNLSSEDSFEKSPNSCHSPKKNKDIALNFVGLDLAGSIHIAEGFRENFKNSTKEEVLEILQSLVQTFLSTTQEQARLNERINQKILGIQETIHMRDIKVQKTEEEILKITEDYYPLYRE